MRKLYLHSFSTEEGTVRTVATDKGLALVVLPRETRRGFQHRIEKHFSGFQIHQGGQVNRQAERQLKSFLAGKRKSFDLKFDTGGTPFQKKVLRQVSRIPYGRTKTYSEIARAIGHPRASRAVGTANKRNLLPLVIPCHRVVAVNGLGGYGGGLAMKERLLKMEGAL